MATVEDLQDKNMDDDEVSERIEDMHEDVDERVETGDLTEEEGEAEHASITEAEDEYQR